MSCCSGACGSSEGCAGYLRFVTADGAEVSFPINDGDVVTVIEPVVSLSVEIF